MRFLPRPKLTGVVAALAVLGAASCAGPPPHQPNAAVVPAPPPAPPPPPDPKAVGANELGEVPVLMYHRITPTPTSVYDRTPQDFRAELERLAAEDYVPVTATDYATGHIDIPAGKHPVVITFDDGYESFYANAYPLLQKYDMKAVVSVIGRYSDLYSQPDVVKHLNYSHLNWDQVRELAEAPLVEIGNHSYDMHDATGKESRPGAKKRKGEDEAHYQEAFRADTEKVQQCIEDATGRRPFLYAYPFGYYSDDSEAILKELGYRITLSCESRNSTVTHDPDSLFLLGRYNRVHGLRSADFFKKMGLEPAPLSSGLVDRP